MRTAPLPPPRTPGRYAVGVVCLGNICRSPMGEVVLRERVDEAGLARHVRVASCGTGGWHVGESMDHRSASALLASGYDPSGHRGQQLDDSWFAEFDLLLAMDSSNLADLGGRSERVHLFRDHDPVHVGADVADPYYGGERGFTEALETCERVAACVVASLQRLPGVRGRA
ncbi:low molecular weight protein-tyrosine-phosphatase [Nocardioides bruguierae]|uniref:protein-tyrosine-phosphatase n=1 Tax=Nocardioides bruguierae TaxID=2945102 RepID=A0A9X2IDZ5_9ACTN|nr:low molecular weight protein-tyrosine-phosphatase [Nocardioides bruguierae]MCM0620286.1 low molecular weight phosphotyrosine protein phosphatase [Nocardioides bruguierae]